MSPSAWWAGALLGALLACQPSEAPPQAQPEEGSLFLWGESQESWKKAGEYKVSWGKLDAEVVEPRVGAADAVVIWLHGLGASGHDFLPLGAHFNEFDESLQRVRFIFPHAPKMPVTINGGMVMPAWYDLTAIQPSRSINRATFEASVEAVQQMIREEMAKGIASTRILLAGFSQGGAVAYQAGLTFEYPLAGILALSTYLAEPEKLVVHPKNASANLLLMHGSQDDVVGVNLGRQSHQWLLERGLSVDMKEYPMAHQVIGEQLVPIAHWMKARLTGG